MSAPGVAVVVPCWRSEETLGDCLRALAAQSLSGFELVIVNSFPGDGSAALVRELAPEATYLESERRLLPHAARDLGLARCRAEILVSTDPDCLADRDWLELLTAPIRAGEAELTVGAMGAVTSDPTEIGVHLCKYAGYLPGLEPGERPIAPSANLAMSRRVWESAGPFPGDRWAGDAILSWRAGERFGPARFIPGAVVRHRHGGRPRDFLRSRRSRGREFAFERMRFYGWTRRRAAIHALSYPALALPPLLAGSAAAVRAGRGRDVLRGLPMHVAGHLAWTTGEAAAYLRRATRVGARR